MDKPAFAAAHYAALLLVVLSCWGAGRLALRGLLRVTPMRRWLAHGLSVCCGLGLAICALQWLAIAGLLVRPAVLALLAAGVLAATWQLLAALAPGRVARSAPVPGLHWTVWLLLFLALGTTLSPLRPPHLWDELAYHLPHAREWARTGALQVSEWLRYAWSPFNYHLLYAAALVLYDDVMPHLLHALAGWVTALLLYQLALRQGLSRLVAGVAALGWLALARGDFGNAYIDMALAMFLLAGWIAFLSWWEAAPPRPVGWLVLAAFLLGVAAGIKYQMLGFLPFFAAAVLLHERRPKTLLLLLAAGLLPCVYWYARNAWLTGDPFDPLGGRLFGFFDWDRADLDYQIESIRDVRDWPSWLLWPAALAPLLPSVRRDAGLRLTLWFGGYAFVVWLVSSHFSRYLMPAYPMLLLLGARVVCGPVEALVARFDTRWARTGEQGLLARGRAQGVVAALLVSLALLTTSRSLGRDWKTVAATPAQRDAFLAGYLWEFKETLDFLSRLPPGARIYQHGMEGALYYAPQPIYGDHFGRWRYRDFIHLPPRELAAKMARLGLDTLVLRISYSGALLHAPQLRTCFDTLQENPMFEVLRLRDGGCPDPARAFLPAPAPQAGFVIGPSSRPAR